MGLVKNILYHIARKEFVPVFKNQTLFPYYHLVRDDSVAHIENLYKYKNKEQFCKDIDFLIQNYRPLDPKELWNEKKAKNAFLLTFDDGLEEIYSVIYPILKQKNIKAVFFINPDFVDNTTGLYKHYISIIINHLEKNNFEKSTLDAISKLFLFSYRSTTEFKKNFINIKYADREKVAIVLELLDIDIKKYLRKQKLYISKVQIQEMMDDGFYFGGHTMSHPYLNQLPHEEQKKEILDSIQWLKEHFNINYSLFGFPYTDKTVSKKLLVELFESDSNLRIFGNSGLKKDFDSRIIQRFSLENPTKNTEKQIVTENLYKYFNKIIGTYKINRK